MSKIIRGTVLAAAVGSAAVYGVSEARALWNENQITEKLKYSFEESDRRIGNVLTKVSVVKQKKLYLRSCYLIYHFSAFTILLKFNISEVWTNLKLIELK